MVKAWPHLLQFGIWDTATIATKTGTRVPLRELLSTKDWRSFELRLTPFSELAFQELWTPGWSGSFLIDYNLLNGQSYGPFSGPAIQSIVQPNSLKMLEQLATGSSSTAAEILKELTPNSDHSFDEAFQGDPDSETSDLIYHCLAKQTITCTEHVLLAMLDVDCEAGRRLKALDITEERILQSKTYQNSAHSEARKELEERLAMWHDGQFRQGLEFHQKLLAWQIDPDSNEQPADPPMMEETDHDLSFQWKRAIQHMDYQRALTVARRRSNLNSLYLNDLAITLGLLEQFEESAKVYERALQESPNSVHLWANYAEDLELTGNHEQALQKLEKALALDPNNSQSLGLKAKLLTDADPQEALQLTKQALDQPNPTVSAWETQGYLYLKLGDNEEARKSLEMFVKLADPAHLWENNLAQRLQHAHELISKLS